jgi:hypothetical protein
MARRTAVHRRRTSRRRLDPAPLPEQLLRALVAAAAEDTVPVPVTPGQRRSAPTRDAHPQAVLRTGRAGTGRPVPDGRGGTTWR